ncbi:MAG: FkbM family methyltransferase [Gemmatimonadaceae bacterium]
MSVHIPALLRKKADRAIEFLTLSKRYAPTLVAKRTLLACYAALLADVNDRSEVSLDLSLGGSQHALQMRKSDIFTLAEILRERQYQLVSSVPDHPVIIDGGAHIGIASLFFASAYPGAQLHCFEPENSNFQLLRQNLRTVPGIQLNAAALGFESGTRPLHVSRIAAMHSLKSNGSGDHMEDVQVVNLTDYMNQNDVRRIDVLKLDVEGSELDVLQGMNGRLRDVSVIVGEFHESMVDEREFYQYLESNGFHRTRRQASGEPDVHIFEVARA